MDAYEHAADMLHEHDRDRFLADLFAPPEARNHLFALHAFDTEIARIRFKVNEPGLGEIRLQWWRDAIALDEPAGNPLAKALLTTIGTLGLPRAPFDALLTAHIFDFYNDPMPTMAGFEGYAGETNSVLVQFSALALTGGLDPGAADASGHAGVAAALTGALWRFSADSLLQKLFLPRDQFDGHGVDIEDVFAAKVTPELAEVLADLIAAARDHLAKAKAAIRILPAAVRPAYLPMALIGPDLKQLERARHRPFEAPRLSALWRRQWRLWRAAKWGVR